MITALIHDHDAVRFKNRRQAVCDDQRGAAFHQMFQGNLHGTFGLGVERAGGFVEQQDGGVFQQCPGDHDTLLLAAGQTGAVFAEFTVKTCGQCLDEVPGFGAWQASMMASSLASRSP